MEIFWILLLLFVVVTMVFVGLAVMFPEWVGITGSVAKQMEADQRGEEPKGNDGV